MKSGLSFMTIGCFAVGATSTPPPPPPMPDLLVPLALDDLQLWLDATHGPSLITSGSTLSAWNDRSGQGNHAGPSPLGPPPMLLADAVRFDRAAMALPAVAARFGLIVLSDLGEAVPGSPVNALIGIDQAITPAPYVFAYVAGPNSVSIDGANSDNGDAAINGHAFEPGDGTGANIAITSPAGFVPMPMGGGPVLIAWRLNAPRAWTALGAFANGNNSFLGRHTVHEVILAHSAPAATTMDRLTGYLAHKWGIASQLPPDHPFKSSPPIS